MARNELDPRAVERVIAAYGFEALRGSRGSGSGAAPAHRLAELHLEGFDSDKRTVARKAAQGMPAGAPPASTATPFDFAMAAQFDWARNGGQASFEVGLELIAEVFPSLGPEDYVDMTASLMRLTVQVEFDEPVSPFLTAIAVESVALDYVRSQDLRRTAGPESGRAASEEALAWATWLLDQRRREARQTTEGYEAALGLLLLVIRRRPKPGYTLAQIVRAAQAQWIGGMHQAHLDPAAFPEYHRPGPAPAAGWGGLPPGDGQIERAMVDLIMGMTEEGLFAVRVTDLESRLVADALERYRTSPAMVRLEDVATDLALARERFPTDDSLAAACLGRLAGEWSGFETLANQFRTAAATGAAILLDWVADVRATYPALLGAAGFGTGDRAFDEVVSFVAVVFGRTTEHGGVTPAPADVKWARACVQDAADGRDWRTRPGVPAAWAGTPA